MRRLGLLVCLALLPGCRYYHLTPAAEAGPLAVQPFVADAAALSVVCMLRTTAVAAAATVVAHDNGVLVGATRGPTYFCYRAEPGLHRLELRTDHDVEVQDVEVIPGERYYLHQDVRNEYGAAKIDVAWVDEATARGLAADSRHVVLTGAPAKERVALAEPVPARSTREGQPTAKRRRRR